MGLIQEQTPVEATAGDINAGLRLDHQLCFPLYTASRLVVQAYKPYLEPLGLTYPQYLVMLVLWENDGASVRQIGTSLRLDSATLTLVLKKLAAAGLIRRRRQSSDGRNVLNHLTAKGRELQETARDVPVNLACRFPNEVQLMTQLKPLLEQLNDLLADRSRRTLAN